MYGREDDGDGMWAANDGRQTNVLFSLEHLKGLFHVGKPRKVLPPSILLDFQIDISRHKINLGTSIYESSNMERKEYSIVLDFGT